MLLDACTIKMLFIGNTLNEAHCPSESQRGLDETLFFNRYIQGKFNPVVW